MLMPWDLQTKLYSDRHHAGKELAKSLKEYAHGDAIVLALPRGGVNIGYELAKALHIPLDVIVARKIGLPENPEFGIGAIGENGARVLDTRVIRLIGIPDDVLKNIIMKEQTELKRRVRLYRKNKPLPNLKNKTVILVDDGLATGVTAKAAIEAIKKQQPKKIIFASPICAYDTAQEFRSLVDEVICLATPLDLMSIGLWYRNFDQVSDEEVLQLLADAQEFMTRSEPGNEGRYEVSQ